MFLFLARNTAASTVGSLFFPLDIELQLSCSRRSPEVVKRVVEQGADSPSFAHASRQLQRQLNVEIGAKEVERLTERIGRQWTETRDQDVEHFKQNTLGRIHTQAPEAVAVMVDGGRAQVRQEESTPGAHQPRWREIKYGNLATLASRTYSLDPQPDPPSKLLQPERVRKLVDQLHDQAVPARQPAGLSEPAARRARRKKPLTSRITRLITTFVATLHNSDDFGYMMAAASAKVGLPPKNAAEQDCRLSIARALDYVTNNYDRMDYPRYRKLGLPCSSAPIESTVKQFSRRLKGTEKFWLSGGAEAVAQVRAACLSQDNRLERLWAQPQNDHAYGLNWARIAA